MERSQGLLQVIQVISLINDVTSTSSKNKNASKLGIPIISEEEFLDIAGRKDLM